MHPFTNNLSWVMEPVKNVRVVKIDSDANDTDAYSDFLQTRGIPNVLFLPADQRERPPPKKIGFGDSGEGREDESKLEDMVAFIFRHMKGAKFDEDAYRVRAKLIQGQQGFLSKPCPFESDKSWCDALLGPSTRMGPKGVRACKDGQLEQSPWKHALKAAARHDRKEGKHERVKAVELVLTKLSHQLAKDIKERNCSEDEAKAVMAEADKACREASDDKGFAESGREREVRFRVTDLRVLDIDTQRWLANVSFTLHLQWPLTFEDVTAIQDDTKQWQPPQLVVKNALTYPDKPNIDYSYNEGPEAKGISMRFYKDDRGHWIGEQRIDVTATIVEQLELEGFPFDIQPLSIILNFERSREPWALRADTEDRTRLICYSAFNALAEWQLAAPMLEVFSKNYGKAIDQIDKKTLEETQMTSDVRPALIVKMYAERNWLQFIWTTWYIVALLGAIGNISFFSHPVDHFMDRCGYLVTNLLAMVAFQQVIDSKLPSLHYISLFQLYMILMNLLVVVYLVESGLSMWEGWEDDSFFFVINLAAWILVQLASVLYVVFVIRPGEKAKMLQLTSTKLLTDDNKPVMAADSDTPQTVFEFTRSEQLFDDEVLVKEGKEKVTVYAFPDGATDDERAVRLRMADMECKKMADPFLNRLVRNQVRRQSAGYQQLAEGGECGACAKAPASIFAGVSKSMKPDFNAAGTSWWQGERDEASTISEQDLKALWSDVFERMDADKSGTVDSQEIANATGRMSSQVKELVAKADKNQDNEVSRDEWDQMLREVLEQVGMPGPSVLDEMRNFASGEPLKCGVGFAKQPHGK